MPDVHFLDTRRPVGDLAGKPQIPVICALDLLEADGEYTQNPDEVTCRDCRDRIHEGQATCDWALCPIHGGDQRDTNVDDRFVIVINGKVIQGEEYVSHSWPDLNWSTAPGGTDAAT